MNIFKKRLWLDNSILTPSQLTHISKRNNKKAYTIFLLILACLLIISLITVFFTWKYIENLKITLIILISISILMLWCALALNYAHFCLLITRILNQKDKNTSNKFKVNTFSILFKTFCAVLWFNSTHQKSDWITQKQHKQLKNLLIKTQ